LLAVLGGRRSRALPILKREREEEGEGKERGKGEGRGEKDEMRRAIRGHNKIK
jgi:hypothetical protein